MRTPKYFRLLALALVGIVLIAWAAPNRTLTATLTEGTPDIKSIGALAFGPENILFAGDAQGAAVFALNVNDNTTGRAEPVSIKDLDGQVAALLGTSKEDIQIHDVAVHPASHNVYLSASRGQGETITPVLLRTTQNGTLEEVSLATIAYSKGAITNPPSHDAKLWRDKARPYAITDLAFVDGQVYVAGLTNEEFASHFRRLPFPFNEEMASTSLEVYHVSHRANETHAPVDVFTPINLDGTLHVVASYTCTPLVSFAVEGLKDGTHVKGKTVAELGAGNRSLGMISYEKEGEEYILIANSRHPLMRVDPKDIAKAKALELPTRERGVRYAALSPKDIRHIASFNAAYVVALQQNGEALDLIALPTASL